MTLLHLLKSLCPHIFWETYEAALEKNSTFSSVCVATVGSKASIWKMQNHLHFIWQDLPPGSKQQFCYMGRKGKIQDLCWESSFHEISKDSQVFAWYPDLEGRMLFILVQLLVLQVSMETFTYSCLWLHQARYISTARWEVLGWGFGWSYLNSHFASHEACFISCLVFLLGCTFSDWPFIPPAIFSPSREQQSGTREVFSLPVFLRLQSVGFGEMPIGTFRGVPHHYCSLRLMPRLKQRKKKEVKKVK